MSRFDDELVRQADNAWQERGLPGSTTPRQMPYDQVTNMYIDGPFGLSSQSPAPAEEMQGWVANEPWARQLNVQDLDAPMQGELIGGPGSSAVYVEGGPVYASNTLDDTLYNVYKASREIRDAIDGQSDFDFTRLFTAAVSANEFTRLASDDQDIVYSVGTVAGLINEIEDNLVVTANYKQAYEDLMALEGYLEDINKFAAADDDEDGDDEERIAAKKKTDCKHCKGKGCAKCKKSEKASDDEDEEEDEEEDEKPAFLKKKKASEEHCTGPGCEKAGCSGRMANGNIHKGSNGNQETLQITDVRDLDDSGSNFTFEKTINPDHKTNVLVPEEVNGEDAGYVNYYNDGSETGIVPQQGPHAKETFPMDGTNPAYAPYAGTVATVQSSREKIFDALQVVERLERLGMVTEDDRLKHVAKFEQMSDAKLAGFKASLDMLEESGARQPRSQKVAKGNNSLPEMGRLTTASTVTRQSVQADDWLMTLK